MTPASEVKVWDPLIRVFHWATVTLCLLNFFVLEEGSKPHRYAGYAVGILLIIRLLWGLVGPYYARFGQWWPTPARVRYYLRQLAQGRHPYYLGHNPVGSLMIWLLLPDSVIPRPSKHWPSGVHRSIPPILKAIPC